MIRKITKFTKISIIAVLLIVVTLAVSLSLIYYFYPADSVKQIIKNKAEILLNRKIEIGSLHYSPKGIVIYNVNILDRAADNSETTLVKADEVVITFSPLSIIKKDFRLRTIYFNGLELNCVFDNDGKSNIEQLVSELKEKTGTSGGDSSIQLSRIILKECRLKLVNPPKFIKPLEGEYLINGTIRIKEKKTFLVSDTQLTLPPGRGILYPDLVIDTAGGFVIRGKVKLENASLLWVYKFAAKDPGLPWEIVNGQVNDLEITKDYIKGSAKATSTLKNTKSIISAEGQATVEVDSKLVHLNNIKGKVNSSTTDLDNMLISSKQGAIKKFSFLNSSVQLSDLRYFLHSIPSALSGHVKGDFSFDGNSYNGKIDASNVSYKDRMELFSNLNTTLEIKNNIVKKENIPVTILGSSSVISIATTDNKFKNFYVSVNSESFNFNNIQFKENNGSNSSSREASGSSGKINIPVNITGKINIKELIYDDFIFKNTRANLTVSDDFIKINNMDTSILSGSISGSGAVDISNTIPSVQASLRFNNIKIQDIKFKNDKMNNRLFGFAEGSANLNLQVKENAAETMKGNATFTVTKGKVVNTGVQDGLIIFLSELRYKLKDLEFNKIYGNINIAGNDYNINSFIFNSEDIRLSISGQLDKELTARNMRMKLEFDKYFIKDVPGGSFLLTLSEYDSGKWYVIPFLLNGNITESKNMKMLKKNQ